MRTLLLLLLTLLAIACAPKHSILRSADIAIGAPLQTIDDGPFRLVYGGPKEDPGDVNEVTLAFSRPVASATGSAPPAKILRGKEPVAGTWTWFAESTAVFQPELPFALASTFRVEPSPLTARDGSPIDPPSITPFEFSTLRPAVMSVAYEYDSDKHAHYVKLFFNQPVAAKTAKDAIAIEGTLNGAKTKIPFKILADFDPKTKEAQGKGTDALILEAEPAVSQLESAFVTVSTAIRAEAGPLAPKEALRLRLEDVGPFRPEFSCQEDGKDEKTAFKLPLTAALAPACDLSTIQLELTREVKGKDFLHHLVVAPPAKLDPQAVKNFLEYGDLTQSSVDLDHLLGVRPGTTYTVTLKAGLQAANHDRLPTDLVMTFKTPDMRPQISLPDLDGMESVVESARSGIPLRVSTINVPAFEAAGAPLTEQALLDLLFVAKKSKDASAAEPPMVWNGTLDREVPLEKPLRDVDWIKALPNSKSVNVPMSASAKRNEYAATTLGVAPERAKGASGAYVVGLRGAPETRLADDLRVFTVTDLGVTTKWSPHGALIWITRLSTAEPVHNASISLRRVWPAPHAPNTHATAQEAFTATTDQNGLATIPSQVVATFLLADPSADETTRALTAAKPVLIVKSGADWTYARPPELDPSLLPAIGEMFVERGIYRPGEPVFIKGYFRSASPRGLLTLAGKTVYVEAVDAEDRVFHATTTTLDAFGAFAVTVPIPRTVRLGFAWTRARVGVAPPPTTRRTTGDRRRWRYDNSWPVSDRFQIDEFRTPEFKITTASDRGSYMRGETGKFTGTAVYLLGAPMTSGKVDVEITRSRTSFSPPGLEDFATDIGVLEPRTISNADKFERVSMQAPLDKDGQATVNYPFPAAQSTSPHRYKFELSVPDVTKAFIVGDEASVTVHPSETYLGIRIKKGKDPKPIIVGQKVSAELASATITGERQANIATRLELFREMTKKEREADGKDKDTFLSTGRTCNLKTDAASFVSCDLQTTDEGQHWIKASAVDTKGRAIAATVSFRVDPKPTAPPKPKPAAAASQKPEPEPIPTVAPDGRKLTFEERCAHAVKGSEEYSVPIVEVDRDANRWNDSERPSYKVGENALLCFRSHWDTRTTTSDTMKPQGLFTLEREGVLQKAILSDLTNTGRLVKIPITNELHPNVHAHIAEIAPRTSPFPASPDHGDWGHPTASNDSALIAVKAPAKKLSVVIQAPPDARPGSEVELHLQVNDGENRPTPAQVTVWAVDEGVSLLVPKSLPSLEEAFSEDRSSDVTSADTRDHVFFEHAGMYRRKGPSVRLGGTSVSAGNIVGRSVFRPTAFFMSNVVTNQLGAAVLKAPLPDNLTTWKVSAVAATVGDSFGTGSTSFKTNKRLMIRPQLPRFLRTGDRFEATAIIDSMAPQAVDAELSVKVTGVLSAPFGPTTTKITIPADGHVPIHFPVEARAVGSGKITINVVGGKSEADEVTIEETVQSIASLENVVIAGEIPPSVEASITNARTGDLSKARADIGSFDYRLSTTPLVGLAESINALIEYPYGCTEQLTSRLVPLVRLRGMARDLGATLPANTDEVVRTSLSALLSHQRDDGGFGFWRGSAKSEAALTILALGALHAAAQNGYAVPQSTIDSARAWLEKPTEPDPNAPKSSTKPITLDLGARAMLEDQLADLGRPRVEELRKLGAEGKLPLFAQALVAHGLANVDRPLASQMLAKIIASDNAKTTTALATFEDESSISWRANLSSNARTTAMVLRAILAIDGPSHPLATKTVRGLLSLRHDGRWATTQASAWALTALEDARPLYKPKQERTTAAFLFDGRPIAKTSFAGAANGETTTGSISMGKLLAAPGAAFGIESDGNRHLYYEGTLRYARKEPPTAPLDRGISIARSIRPLRAAASSPTDIHVGDYAVVDVVIATTSSRDLVVVDDPIPAGFEAVNQTFANLDRGSPIVVDPSSIHLSHRELRDDRVLSFYDALPAGAHVARYVLRATSPGRFALPPAKAECMYTPDIFGRTASTWADIK